ncbi:transcription initiation factor IID, 18kD subunit-domain-containing protein [Thamnocephalis sphaerospora]|uniref:Transcription initiation factor IID, 18kD subunit-domain-containing protein n=1 Tax=Thamnocephalis sphaerospora TaxID=78915 RepID=A0A4P9XXB2_9FUNG|nr:transcription initiation factor IID, 18kD subunit-domain-containing protein [Thamnocephalis sphaerospora]|eukprot:RKP10311.1 transcription initiation factor IID, 18kD subunit-domain-containing protein [Thamnocephalis sphaerospora]
MFVFGEVADSLPETTALVEDIVRSQVIEITIQAAAQAQKRGSRGISQEDLMFIIRHDRSKVNRLRTFLSWKDVRRNAKDSQGGTAGPGAPEPAEDLTTRAFSERPAKGRKRIKLPWELINTYADVLNEDDEEEEDEEEVEAYRDSMQRLKDADEITRRMTRDEYVHYSECRQASFTYRKAKRFREWANMSAYTDVKPNDDLIDILGFLSFEMVRTITEAALAVKQAEEASSAAAKSGAAGKLKRASGGGGGGGLFAPPDTGRTPIRAEHVMEGYRRLQHIPRPSWLFRGGLARSRASII